MESLPRGLSIGVVRGLALTLAGICAAALASGCSRSDSGQDSLVGVVAGNVVSSILPGKFRTQNLPGSFSMAISGQPGGKYWDQHGRVYGVELSIWCSGRDSTVRLRFPVTVGSANPLPQRGPLQIAFSVDGAPARWVAAEPGPALTRLHGDLALVREILASEQVAIRASSFEQQPIDASFDTRGLRDAAAKHDFFCKQQWLSAARQAGSSAASPPQAPQSAGDLALQRETVRAKVSALDGVTSVIWLADGTLMLGMGNATNRQKGTAALDACDVLGTHLQFPQRVEVQDTRSARDEIMRVTCPRSP